MHDILVVEVGDGLDDGADEGGGVSLSVAALGDDSLKELSAGGPIKTQHRLGMEAERERERGSRTAP